MRFEYQNTTGNITDPEYSITVGIQNLATCLTQAGADSPENIDRVSLALQGYNFGSGYISRAFANYGCYSELNALELSSMMAQRQGWLSYGAPYYVQHMLRYYETLARSNQMKRMHFNQLASINSCP